MKAFLEARDGPFADRPEVQGTAAMVWSSCHLGHLANLSANCEVPCQPTSPFFPAALGLSFHDRRFTAEDQAAASQIQRREQPPRPAWPRLIHPVNPIAIRVRQGLPVAARHPCAR
ncbi:MAG: hypothetical protein U0Z44_13240 [Kouleothrix sp.]